MAYVQGTRTAVWLIVALVRDHKGNAPVVAKSRGWPAAAVDAALKYAKSYPSEIQALIKMNEERSDFAALKRVVPDLETSNGK